MRYIHSLPAALAAASILLASPTALVAQKSDGSAPKPIDNPAEYTKATQCAAFYQFMVGMMPPGAPPRTDFENRSMIWLDYAGRANLGGKAAATTKVGTEAQALQTKVMATEGNEEAATAILRPLNDQCENAPPASVPLPAAPVRQVTISESDKRTSEGKLECAGLHRYFKRKGSGSTLFNGDEALFVGAAAKQRPDLTPAQIEEKVEGYRKKWDDAYTKATDDYVAALRTGSSATPKLPDGLMETSEQCDSAARFLR